MMGKDALFLGTKERSKVRDLEVPKPSMPTILPVYLYVRRTPLNYCDVSKITNPAATNALYLLAFLVVN